MPRTDHSRAAITLIGAFKLLKAAALLVLAMAAHRLLQRDVGEQVVRWLSAVHVDPGNALVHAALAPITRLDERQLREFSASTVLFAGLYLAEGFGLLLRRRWAEYLTVVSTALLLPLEFYELAHHPTAGKAVVLVANGAVVVYLVIRLRTDRGRADELTPP